MKIITQPSVYVVGRQVVDEAELNRFLGDMDVTWESDSEVGAEVLTETAGRVCYLSFAKPRPGGNSAYLNHIKEVGHGSVLEHAVWNLLITGVSRSLTHELVRHRVGMSPSQLSQRYVDESVAEYVVPPDLREEVAAAVQFICHCQHSPIWKHGATDKFETQIEWALDVAGSQPAKEFQSDEEEALTLAGLLWLRSMVRASEDYRHQSAYLTKKAQASGMSGTDARKFARQAARSVLPNATETKIFVTGNARALRHFLEMRGSRHADTEIRRLAGAMLDVLVKESPNLFGDYQKTALPDGTHEITTQFMKV